MGAVCSTNFGNTGVKCNLGDVRGVPVGLLLTTKTFSFDSFVDFADESKHKDAIKGKEMFPIGDFLEFDDNTEEAVYYNSALGVDKFLRDGKYKLVFRGDYGLAQNKELQKFSGMKGRAFIIDSAGYIWGYSDDGESVQGFSIATFKVENQKIPTADAPGWSSLNVTFANPREWNDFGVAMKPSFIAQDMVGLSNVDLTIVGTPSDTEIIVSVGNPTGLINDDGTINRIEMAGIPIGDFKFLEVDGVTVQTPDSMTETGEGVYKFVFTALHGGTVDLISPSTQSNDYLIESTGAASFVV